MADHEYNEPWVSAGPLGDCTMQTSIENSVGMRIADVRWREESHRIVACVNACKGISTERLEAGALGWLNFVEPPGADGG